jgi:CRP/FNR family transcriptional regulator
LAAPVEFLQSSPYFAGMSLPELESIAGLFYQQSIGKGEIITFEGDPGEALYFVASGAVKCFKVSSEGKEQILQIVLPGGSFNDVAIFDGGPSPTSTEAMSLVNCYVIARQDMQRILKDYPKMAPNVINVLSKKIRHLLDLVEDLSFRQVIGRIARRNSPRGGWKIVEDIAGRGFYPNGAQPVGNC